MASFRIPGPMNALGRGGLSSLIQLRSGHPPGPIGSSPATPRATQAVQTLPAADVETADAAGQPAAPVSYRELMSGLRLSVYDVDTGVPADPNSFSWQVPFRTRGGQWIMEPRPIDSNLRNVRDRFIDLLSSSRLPNHISGMLRRTRLHHAERKAYITADGNIGGIISGESHRVGNLNIPADVSPIAEIHTHPPSPQLAPPSYQDDFRRNLPQLVAEYTNGRLWIAAWPNLALLIGQIVVGENDDRHARFRPIARSDPRRDNVFHMSNYVPRSRRIPPV
jgi:hypothetical protein